MGMQTLCREESMLQVSNQLLSKKIQDLRRQIQKKVAVQVVNMISSADALVHMEEKVSMIQLEEKVKKRRRLLVMYKFPSLLHLHLQKFRKKEETRKKIKMLPRKWKRWQVNSI